MPPLPPSQPPKQKRAVGGVLRAGAGPLDPNAPFFVEKGYRRLRLGPRPLSSISPAVLQTGPVGLEDG